MIENPSGVVHVAAPSPALRELAATLIRETLFQPPRAGYEDGVIERCANYGMIGAIEEDDGVAATVGIAPETLPHTDEAHLRVHWLGVHESRRRSDYAKHLIGFVEWCAGLFGDGETMPLLIPTLTSRELLPKMRLYERRVPQVQALFAFGCSPDYPRPTGRQAGAEMGRPGSTGGTRHDGRDRQSRPT